MTIKKLTISVFRLVVRDSPPDPGGGGGRLPYKDYPGVRGKF